MAKASGVISAFPAVVGLVSTLSSQSSAKSAISSAVAMVTAGARVEAAVASFSLVPVFSVCLRV